MNEVTIDEEWRRLVERLAQLAPDPQLIEDLDDFQARLQRLIFGDLPTFPEPRPDVAAADPRLGVVLDALETLALLEPRDPSYPRERGALLFKVGRNLEAADDFLEAARRFEQEAVDGTGLTGDEEDWAATALGDAAKNLALGGQRAAATALLLRLDAEDCAKVKALLAAGVDAA
jgi:hypothetical protein